MNDVLVSAEVGQSFPSVVQALKKASDIFEQIKSFEDLERLFLKGAGLSPNTYRSYLEAVRQFYHFTKGLNPLQVRPADIEAFYDHLLTKVDLNTAYLRIRGLKKFFAGVRNVVPFYSSPFEIMGEKLHGKLSLTKTGKRTKAALTAGELKALLEYLQEDKSIRGVENYALIFMLATSGLRASELCSLTWGDLECVEGAWTAMVLGKGGRIAEQELFPQAVDACRAYFRRHFGREPKEHEALFWTLPELVHQRPAPMSYHTLWNRICSIGQTARRVGLIKRDVRFSPHLLRRSYATILYRSGMKLKSIQCLTRHASIETLCMHYIDDREAAAPYLSAALVQRDTL